MHVDVLFQSDDYISIRMGGGSVLDDTVGSLLVGRPAAPVPVFQDVGGDHGEHGLEEQFVQFPANVTPSEGGWQTVNGTR